MDAAIFYLYKNSTISHGSKNYQALDWLTVCKWRSCSSAHWPARTYIYV